MARRLILALVVVGLCLFGPMAAVDGFGKSGDVTPLYAKQVDQTYVTALKAVGVDPSEVRNYSIGQSHIDAAWLWRVHQTREKCIKTFSAAIEHMKQYPDFHFSQSSPQYYEWVMEDDPALFEEIKSMVAEGRWEIVGGQWVEPDNNMPDGESFCRQVLLGQRFYQEHFGKTSEIAWLLDSFGYNWNLPQFLAKSGAKYFWTNKLTWNDTTIFPFHLFHWRAPDGSQVLSYFIQQCSAPVPYPIQELGKYHHTRYLLPDGAPELVADYNSDSDSLREQLSGEWMPTIGVFYGKGDGGHGPITSEIKWQLGLAQNGHTQLSPATDLYADLDQYASKAPVWNDELYLEYHRGTLTTHAEIKRANRENEENLRAAEVVQSIASRFGLAYAYDQLKALWKLLLLNQFHDILPGSSIPEVYADAMIDHDAIREGAKGATNDALGFIANQVNVSAQGGRDPVVVFNPLSWERTGVVAKPLPDYMIPECEGRVAVEGPDGRPTPAQRGACFEPAGVCCLYFLAEDVPSLGYKVYYLLDRRDEGIDSTVKVDESGDAIVLDNGLVKLAIDKGDGWMKSLVDLRSGTETLAGDGVKIMAFADHASNYPAWNIQHGYLDRPKEISAPDKVWLSNRGPLFAEIHTRRKLNQSEIVQVTRLFAGEAMARQITVFDFKDPNTLVKLAVDTTINGDQVVADIPYAVIDRPTHPDTPAEKAQWEASCQKWLDLSDGGRGLAILNNGKYGYSLNDDGTGFRLTLLKAAQYPTSANEAYDVDDAGLPQAIKAIRGKNRMTDQGRSVAFTALYPHAGDWRQARLWQAGAEFNAPLLMVSADGGNGSLPETHSFISVDDPNVYIGSVKRAEDDHDLVIRLVEATGTGHTATVTLDGLGAISAAVETDLLEWAPKPVSFGASSFTVNLGPYEIKTVKVSLGR